MTHSKPVQKQIERTALGWLQLLTSEAATDNNIRDFEQWLDSSPSHGLAYAKISQTCCQLDVLAVSPQGLRIRESLKPSIIEFIRNLWSYRPMLSGGIAGAALILIILGLTHLPQWGSTQAPLVYQTARGQVRDIQLPDDSTVTLGAKSSMEVLYTHDKRTITFLQGQAFFKVAKQTDRPFIVRAPGTDVTVLGTQFDVHLGPNQVTIAVLDGRIRVAPVVDDQHQQGGKLSPAFSAKILTMGQSVVATPKGLGSTLTRLSIPAGSWRDGRLIYKSATLETVVADANRYYQNDIVIADKQLKNTLISTSFEVSQVDQFLNTLPVMYPIEVIHHVSGKVLIKSVNTNYPQ